MFLRLGFGRFGCKDVLGTFILGFLDRFWGVAVGFGVCV